jgi:hypothetical protein
MTESEQRDVDAADEPRPWRLPGAVPRDCAPHRSEVLRLLGLSSLACGLLAFCLGATALLGLPLGLAAWVLARYDLPRMRDGLMDPAGWGDVLSARESGREGALLSAVYLVFWGGLFLLLR